jgi:hypothetical protein
LQIARDGFNCLRRCNVEVTAAQKQTARETPAPGAGVIAVTTGESRKSGLKTSHFRPVIAICLGFRLGWSGVR